MEGMGRQERGKRIEYVGNNGDMGMVVVIECAKHCFLFSLNLR